MINNRLWTSHMQVRSQLAAFGASMEKDSAAQRGEVATLVQSAAERGKEFIDDTLQLSNVQASCCVCASAQMPEHSILAGKACRSNGRECGACTLVVLVCT